MLAVVVDHRRAVSGGIEHAVDDPADAPAPRDDDRIVLVDGIGLAAATFSGSNYAVAFYQDRSLAKLGPYGGMSLIGGWLALTVL